MFNPWVGKILWRKAEQPTPVLPGEFYGQRSLAGYSPWSRKESDTTERLSTAQQGLWGFPGSSAGKESACNAGDPGTILGLRSSPGEGIGYPRQYSWASLVAQTVNNPPAVRETWI